MPKHFTAAISHYAALSEKLRVLAGCYTASSIHTSPLIRFLSFRLVNT